MAGLENYQCEMCGSADNGTVRKYMTGDTSPDPKRRIKGYICLVCLENDYYYRMWEDDEKPVLFVLPEAVAHNKAIDAAAGLNYFFAYDSPKILLESEELRTQTTENQ